MTSDHTLVVKNKEEDSKGKGKGKGRPCVAFIQCQSTAQAEALIHEMNGLHFIGLGPQCLRVL